MKTLDEIRAAIHGMTGNDTSFSLLNVRVMLRTGVNLKAIKQHQNTDPRAVRVVLSALTDLGYDVGGHGGTHHG